MKTITMKFLTVWFVTLLTLGFASDAFGANLLKVETVDADKDGQLDQLVLTFNRAVTVIDAEDDSSNPDGFDAITLDQGYQIAPNDYTSLTASTTVTFDLIVKTEPDTGVTPTLVYQNLFDKDPDGDGSENLATEWQKRDKRDQIVDNMSGELEDTTKTSIDKAVPVIVDLATMDDDRDGKVDMYRVTWSEPVSDASLDFFKLSSTGLILTDRFASPASETDAADDEVQYLGVYETENPNTAATGDVTAQAALLQDLAATPNVSEAVATGTVTERDGAAPVLLKAVAVAESDKVNVTFSEAVYARFDGTTASGALEPSGFVWENSDGRSITAAAFEEGSETGELTLSSAIGANEAIFNLRISVADASVFDVVGNGALTDEIAVTDGGRPRILGAHLFDMDRDGNIDEIVAEFSKEMDDSTITNGTGVQWVFGGEPGIGIDNTTTSSTAPSGNFPQNTMDPGTSNDRFITVFTDDATVKGTSPKGLRFVAQFGKYKGFDGSDEAVTSTEVQEFDEAPPVPIRIRTGDEDLNGKVDYYEMTWSERVDDDSYDGEKAFVTFQDSSVTLTGDRFSLPGDVLNDEVIFVRIQEGVEFNTDDTGDFTADAGLLADWPEGLHQSLAVPSEMVGEEDNSAPILVSALGEDNKEFIQITFSEPVYSRPDRAGRLLLADIEDEGIPGVDFQVFFNPGDETGTVVWDRQLQVNNSTNQFPNSYRLKVAANEVFDFQALAAPSIPTSLLTTLGQLVTDVSEILESRLDETADGVVTVTLSGDTFTKTGPVNDDEFGFFVKEAGNTLFNLPSGVTISSFEITDDTTAVLKFSVPDGEPSPPLINDVEMNFFFRANVLSQGKDSGVAKFTMKDEVVTASALPAALEPADPLAPFNQTFTIRLLHDQLKPGDLAANISLEDGFADLSIASLNTTTFKEFQIELDGSLATSQVGTIRIDKNILRDAQDAIAVVDLAGIGFEIGEIPESELDRASGYIITLAGDTFNASSGTVLTPDPDTDNTDENHYRVFQAPAGVEVTVTVESSNTAKLVFTEPNPPLTNGNGIFEIQFFAQALASNRNSGRLKLTILDEVVTASATPDRIEERDAQTGRLADRVNDFQNEDGDNDGQGDNDPDDLHLPSVTFTITLKNDELINQDDTPLRADEIQQKISLEGAFDSATLVGVSLADDDRTLRVTVSGDEINPGIGIIRIPGTPSNNNPTVTSLDLEGVLRGPDDAVVEIPVDSELFSIIDATGFDVDGNGHVDEVVIRFSKQVDDSTITGADVRSFWKYDGVAFDGVDNVTDPSDAGAENRATGNPLDPDTANDEFITLFVPQGTFGDDTTVRSVTFDGTTGGSGKFTDFFGHELPAQASITEVDRMPPILLSVVTQDANGDGSIERYVLTWSEPVEDNSGGGHSNTFDASKQSDNTFQLTGGKADVGADNDEVFAVLFQPFADTGAAGIYRVEGGLIEDEAGNESLPNFTAISPGMLATDGAPPRFMFLRGDAGTQELLLGFSEAVFGNQTGGAGFGSLALSDFGFSNFDQDPTSGTIDFPGGDRNGSITLPSALTVEERANATISIQGSEIFDQVGQAVPLRSLGITDNTPLVVQQATILDTDGDGNVDEIVLEFSEPVVDNSVSSRDAEKWTFAGFQAVAVDATTDPQGGFLAKNTVDPFLVNDEFVTIFTNTTRATGSGPAELAYTSDGTAFRDLVGNALDSTVVVNLVDQASPVLVSLSTGDADEDGRVDFYKLVFSEEVNVSTFDNTKDEDTVFALSGTLVSPGGGSPVNGQEIFVGITEDAQPNSGTVGSYSAAEGLIKDLANFVSAEVTGLTPKDGAPPVLLAAIGEAGSKEIAVKFSEPVYTAFSAIGGLSEVDFILADADGREIDFVSFPPGNTEGVLTLTSPLQGDDLDADTLSPAPAEIYDGAENQAPANPLVVTTNLPPEILSATLFDVDGDGSVDEIVVKFSKAIRDSTVSQDQAGQWTFGGNPLTAVDNTTDPAGPIPQNSLDPQEKNDKFMTFFTDETIAGTGFGPQVKFTEAPRTFEDFGSQTLASDDTVNEVDAAGPVPTAVEALDGNADGRIDMYRVTWSEAVNDLSFDTSKAVNNPDFVYTGSLVFPDGDTANDSEIFIGIEENSGPNTAQTGDFLSDAGLVRDPTGNDSVTVDSAKVIEADGAAPVLLFAFGEDGSADILVTFSEGVFAQFDGTTASGPLEPLDFMLADNNMNLQTIEDVIWSVGASSGTVRLSSPVTPEDLDSDTLRAVQDAVLDAVGLAADTRTVVITSDVPPTVLSVTAYDVDSDGNIDEVVIEFNKGMDDSTISNDSAGQWTFGGIAFDAVDVVTDPAGRAAQNLQDPGAANDAVITLFADNVTGTGVRETVFTAAAGTFVDLVGNPLAATTVNEGDVIDKAPPVLLTAKPLDNDGDGMADAFEFVFSEDVFGTPAVSDWTLAEGASKTNLLDGVSDGDITVNGSAVTITLKDHANAFSTEASFFHGFDGSSGSLADADGNTVSSFSNNQEPTVDAGDDQTVNPSLVTLDGSGSSDPEGFELSYLWELTDKPIGVPDVTLSDPTAVSPTFGVNADGVYTFRLTVDDQFHTVSGTVTVTVNNIRPTADAGSDFAQDRDDGDPAGPERDDDDVVLDGGFSSDPNDTATTSDIPADTAHYVWELVDGPNGASDPNVVLNPGAEPWIVAFDSSKVDAGFYTFRLTVTDNGFGDSGTPALSDSDEVVVALQNNELPVAHAGHRQVVAVNELVTLDGRGSSDGDGDPLNYDWDVVGAPDGVALVDVILSDEAAAQPTFRPTVGGVYTFSLKVQDVHMGAPKQFTPTADEVQVVVLGDVPVADAGLDKVVEKFDTVALDGSASIGAVTYEWTQTKGPVSVDFGGTETSEKPTFSASQVGVYTFSLIVSNGTTKSPADTVCVTVNDTETDSVPTADAGELQTVEVNTPVKLDGAGSTDNDSDGDSLTYSWTQLRGAPASPNDKTLAEPTFTPLVPGVYVWELTVRDGTVKSKPDTVFIVVNDTSGGNSVPTAEAGANVDGTINMDETLNGSGNDVDGDSLTNNFVWTQTKGPWTALTNRSTATPTLNAPDEGVYGFTLRVIDGSAWSLANTMNVTLSEPKETEAPATDGGDAPAAGGGGGSSGCFVGSGAAAPALAWTLFLLVALFAVRRRIR